jgi:hypothetical protein
VNILKKVILAALFNSLYFSAFAQALVTHGDFILRGTALVQYQGNETNVTIPANLGITEIAEGTFSMSYIETVIIPEGVKILRTRSFTHGYKLRSVTIPASVTSIEEVVFAGYSHLQEIVIHPNNRNYVVEGGVLYNASKTTILYVLPGKTGSFTVSNSVVKIASCAFDNSALTSVAIPASVTSIESDAFDCSSLSEISVNLNNSNYTSVDRVLYNKAKTAFIHIPGNLTGAVSIPAGVTSIEDYAFYGRTGLTSLTIPASVTGIGDNVFYGCTDLRQIIVEQNNKNYVSADGVLYTADKTTLIKFPAEKTGSYTIPLSVTSIAGFAFHGCTGLISITIPASVTSIENYAFYGCTGLISITIPASVTGIGGSAFSGCTGLTSLTIPASVTSIAYYAFSGCTGLTMVTFTGTISSANFSSSFPFPGDLRAKYLAAGGGAGTYSRTAGSNTWTKQ